MLVSHESPLALLEKSREYNDYDYCLVHLLDQYPDYLKFFKDSKKLGRRILLDNSIFELGTAFDPWDFAKYIKEIEPDEYVVPDMFDNSALTIANFKEWKRNFPDIKGNKIGVVQGDTYKTMVECYKFMVNNADKIAINFASQYFKLTGFSSEENATEWHHIMRGRQKFIRDLISDGFWAWGKPHHLLGCTLPQEFVSYQGIVNIESIDTSNPVVAGMHDVRYNSHGLDDKIPTKLADILEQTVTDEHLEIILYNIKQFVKINKIK